MASFYGNIKNNSRASFIFDRIYPSRAAMEDALNAVQDNVNIGDGIFINRYVLVDYHYLLADTLPNDINLDGYFTEVSSDSVNTRNYASFFTRQEDSGTVSYIPATTVSSEQTYYIKKIYVDRYENEADVDTETHNLIENKIYYNHRLADWERYSASYDCTVWMKIYADGKERYILVGDLNAKAPILDFIDDAPSCQNGSGHIDQRASTDLNYLYYMPKNWDMVLNQYNPEEDYSNESYDEYYYYQQGLNDSDNWYQLYIPTADETYESGKAYYSYYYLVDPTILPEDSEIYKNESGEYELTTDFSNDINYYQKSPTLRLVTWSGAGDSIVDLQYYEYNTNKTFNNQVEYPYFNKAGFDKQVSTKVDETGSGINLSPVASAQTYPTHVFVHAGVLTKDTYLPNRYFTYIGTKKQVEDSHIFNPNYAYYVINSLTHQYDLIYLILDDTGKYIPSKEADAYYYDEDIFNPNLFIKSTYWENNVAYYELTWQFDVEGNKVVGHEDDTYRVDVYFPILGNMAADIYDLVYGQPRIAENKNDGYNNLIGYCSKEQLVTYGHIVGYCSQDQLDDWSDSEGDNYLIDENGHYIIGPDEQHFELDSNAIDSLSSEPNEETGQTIPIFATGVIGYCSQADIAGWTQDPNGDYITGLSSIPYDLTSNDITNLSPIPDENEGKTIPVYMIYRDGDYQGGGKTFDLTDDQIAALSPEIIPGRYDIPIYAKDGSNIRPYDDDKLYSGLTTPYDNIGDEEVSLGWMLTLLKQYLSELRYLAVEGGLQSDWQQEDQAAFGYINNRPSIITTYVLTEDASPVDGKYYYTRSIINGEITFTKVDLEEDRILGYISVENTDFDNYYVNQIGNEGRYIRINNTYYNLSSLEGISDDDLKTQFHISNEIDGDYVLPVYDLSRSTNHENDVPNGLGYFELPKSPSNKQNANSKSVYIRCPATMQYEQEQDYYMSNGYGGYIPAQYIEYLYTSEPTVIESNNDANTNSLVNYLNEYLVTKDVVNEEQVIIQREYKCSAMHDSTIQFANIGLYFGEYIENSYVGKPVARFSIISTGNNNNDAADYLTNALDLNTINNTKTSELTILNNILSQSNTSIDITTDYISTGWPVITELNDSSYQNKFFYAVRTGTENYSALDATKFAEDPTKYYIMKKELQEMDEYEIHNLWNSVVEF